MKPLAHLADAQLVARVRGGDRCCFSEIVRRHRPLMLGVAHRVLPGAEAEDAVQDALVLALRALERQDHPVVLRPWLAVIARNRALDITRRRHVDARELHPELPDARGDVVDMVARREQLSDTVRRLRDLPERQRVALVAQAFEGASLRDTAARLGTTEMAVKGLVHRARTGLAVAA